MASPGRSMGLVLHDDEASRMTDQLAWVSNSVSLGAAILLWQNIWLGGNAFTKNKLTRRAVPCFSLKLHEPAGSVVRAHRTRWCFHSCSLQDGLVELKSLLSVGPCLYLWASPSENIFEDKAGRLNAMIGWISSLVNTRFSSTPPFHSTRNNRHTTQPLRRISGYCRPGRFTEAFWESKMGTQYTTDIPFSSSHHQQALKLLELPPELLALLESDNPPMCVHPLLLPSTRLKYSAD